MKFVMYPYHIISLGGYIVEFDFPYRNIIVVNKTAEPIKFEIPVFHEDWIHETEELGLEVIPVREEDNYLQMYKKAHADLQAYKSKMGVE